MRVETVNHTLQALYDSGLMGDQYDPPGVFHDTGTPQGVPAEIGERPVECGDIEPYE